MSIKISQRNKKDVLLEYTRKKINCNSWLVHVKRDLIKCHLTYELIKTYKTNYSLIQYVYL